MGTDGVRVAGAATMNYLQATMLTGGHCFLWYAIGDDLRNRRNRSCRLHDASDNRPAPAPGGSGGGQGGNVPSIGSMHIQGDVR
jgi:hypothetical protein